MVEATQTQLIQWMEGFLGASRRSGNDNAAFKCPFHEGGKHGGWSFTMNVHNGMSNCKSCGKGWTLYQLMEKLGVDKSVYKALRDQNVFQKMVTAPRIAKALPDGLPEEVLYLFPLATRRELPFPGYVLNHFDVRVDTERGRLVYPVRDDKGVLRALHYRALTGDTRYMFYTKDELAQMGVEHTPQGKEGCFINGHNVIPKLWTSEWDWVILTEGPKQAMRVYEAGYDNVIASMGDMGAEQFRILTRLDSVVFILTDNDDPGRAAASKYSKVLTYRNVKSVIVSYKDCKTRQPDEFILEALAGLVESALDNFTDRRQS